MGEDLREKVRERYAGVARAIQEGTESGGSCCGPVSCGVSGTRALEVDMTGGGYSEGEKRELPQLASDASLGCGNPMALAALSPGRLCWTSAAVEV